MPKLNSRGSAAMGVGDGTVSVDRDPLIYRAGGVCWLDDSTLLVNEREPDGAWHVARCHLPEALVIPIDDGANDLVAGGGRWLGWNPARGMFGSIGDVPKAGVLAAGRDGTLAYCRDRQLGVGFVLNAPDGSEMDVGGVIVYDMQVLGPQSAIWYDGSTIHAVGRPLPKFAVPPGRTRLVTVDGDDWLIYWSEGVGLIAQLDGALDGYVLETEPKAFNHDAVSGYGQIVVCWSTTQGERPNDLVWRLVDRKDPRVPLVKATPVPPPTPAPNPQPQTPKPTPPVKPREPMPTVTYDQFVNHESHAIRQAYKDANRWDSMNESDLAHTFWRRLVEHWTLRDVIHDIKGEPYEDGGMGGDKNP